MRTHLTLVIAGVLLGMTMLTAANGLLVGRSSLAAGNDPLVDQTVALQAVTPEAGNADMATKMEQMVDECLEMMKNMNAMMGMMGGDMAGMMGDEGMAGMDEMPAAAATPGA